MHVQPSGYEQGTPESKPLKQGHVLQARVSLLCAQVIASTEDIPSRCFEGWHAAFIGSNSTTQHMDPVDSTTCVRGDVCAL